MSNQLIQNVKGTRDFYPEEKAYLNWFYTKVKSLSEQYGYQEYDGPEIEYLDLYADKTSEEILKEQAFTMQDRDGRTLILRPELTPTFARMVAQRVASLPTPIRWWMFGRCWRYEKPQKGRGREFFQWEINILGVENEYADAEILSIAAKFLKTLNLTPEEVTIRVNDRSAFEDFILELGIPKEKYISLLRIIDRKEKINEQEFFTQLTEQGLNNVQISRMNEYFIQKDLNKAPWLKKVLNIISQESDLSPYIEYDPTITRGLDYYTRTVFEAWDRTGGIKRALFGGGRFDNLTQTMGGDRIPGVGMAPGDMAIKEMLLQQNKFPTATPIVAKAYITLLGEENLPYSAKVADLLRTAQISVEQNVQPELKLEKQIKYALSKNIQFIIIAGPDEAKTQTVTIKNLVTREQITIPYFETSSWLSKHI